MISVSKKIKYLSFLLFSLMLISGCGSDISNDFVFNPNLNTINIAVEPSTATIEVGELIGFTATGTDQFGQNVTGDVAWSIGSGNAATIDSQSGIATGVAQGQVTVVATLAGSSGTATLTVNPATAPSVTVDPEQLTLVTGAAAVDAFPNATVSSARANFNGGTLTVSANAGGNQNVAITVPPSIGVVSNNGTANVSVALDANSTPDSVQAALRGTTVAGTGAGSGQLEVTLAVNSLSATATRNFASTGIRQLADNGFQDISADPGAMSFPLGDDVVTPVQDIGFDFTLFGVDFRNIFIGSNGYVSDVPFTGFSNAQFPDAGDPALIAPYYDDLINGDVFILTLGEAPNRRTIVQWEMFDHFGGGAEVETFQVIFFETSNRLEFHYETTTEGGSGATIGVQSDMGAEFFQFAFATANSITNGLSLEIIAP